MKGQLVITGQNMQTTILPMLLLGVCVILGIMLFLQQRQVTKLKYRLAVKTEQDMANREAMISGGFFDNILEADVTRNRLIGPNCVQLTSMLGIPRNTSFSNCIEAIIHKMVVKEYHALYRECFDQKNLLRKFNEEEYIFSFEFIEKSDMIHEYWTRVTVFLYYSEASDSVKLISYVNNIQQEKRKELGQRYLINTDYMTGLLNKRAAEERINTLFSTEMGATRHHALMVIDVDRFKQVNDTIGHAGGDKALCIVAQLIEKHFKVDDLVCRIGGDEFLVVMKDYGSERAVASRIERLNASVASQNTAQEVGISLSLSVGIALYPEHGTDYPSLFAAADAALYYVKENNRNGYCFFNKITS